MIHMTLQIVDGPAGRPGQVAGGVIRGPRIAYEVADAAQRRGVGQSPLRRAACSALAVGVECFLAQLSGGEDALHPGCGDWAGNPTRRSRGSTRLPVSLVASAGY